MKFKQSTLSSLMASLILTTDEVKLLLHAEKYSVNEIQKMYDEARTFGVAKRALSFDRFNIQGHAWIVDSLRTEYNYKKRKFSYFIELGW